MLHTWSLAVEEQFYLGYPLLLVLLSRRRRITTGWILAAITIASFAVSQWGVHASPRATFFLLPTRAWEMLLGGLLWFAPLTSRLTERRAELASWISLTGILGAAWLFDSNTLFPGLAACLPCGATALLIYANSVHTTRVAKLLSLGPLVFVGLISYSLYLWHWPLFVFSRYGMTEPLSMAHRFGLLVLSGIVGYLSWRFVETPWRRGFRFRSERPAMVMAAGAVAFVVIAGLGVRNHDGLPSRFDVRTRHLLATMQNGQFRQSVPMDAIQRGSLPEFGAEGRPIGLLVWGDSHAMAMIPAIDHVCRQRGICGVQATYASTLPLAGFSTGRKWEASPNYAGHVLRFAIDNRIPLVVLAGYWSRDASHPDFALSLQHTVDCLSKAGCRVIVVRDIPEQQPGLKQTLIAALSRDQRMDTLGVDLSQHRQRQAAADLALLAVQSERVSVVDPTPFLLDEHERCRIVVNGESLYRNQDHLSRVGAIRLAPMFDPRIRQLAAMPGRRRF